MKTAGELPITEQEQQIHKTRIKKDGTGCDGPVGRHLREAYEHGKIQSESEVEEVLKHVLSVG